MIQPKELPSSVHWAFFYLGHCARSSVYRYISLYPASLQSKAYYPHFTDEKPEAQKFSNLLKETQLIGQTRTES